MSDPWAGFDDPWGGFAQPEPTEIKSTVFKEYAKSDLMDAGARGFFGDLGMPSVGEAVAQATDPLNMAASVRSVGAQIGERLLGVANRFVGRGLAADDAHRWAKAYEEAADELTPRNKYVAKRARGVAASLLPSAALARVTGSAAAPIALATAQEGSEAYQEAGDAGLTGSDRTGYAAKQAAWEALPALLFQRLSKIVPGMGGTESALARLGQQGGQSLRRAGQQALIGGGSELVEEGMTTLGQQATAGAAGVDPTAFAPENLQQALLDTAVETVASAGLAEAPGLAQSGLRTADVAARRAEGRPETPAVTPEQVAQVISVARESGTVEALEALAAKESPSRADWANAGLPPEMGKSQGYRKQFASTLKGLLESERAQPEVVPPDETQAPAEVVAPAPAEAQAPAEQTAEDTQAPPDYNEFATSHKYSVRKQPDGTYKGVVEGPLGTYEPQATDREAAKREAFEAMVGLPRIDTPGQPAPVGEPIEISDLQRETPGVRNVRGNEGQVSRSRTVKEGGAPEGDTRVQAVGEEVRTQTAKQDTAVEADALAERFGVGQYAEQPDVLREAVAKRVAMRTIQEGGDGQSWRTRITFAEPPSAELRAAVYSQLHGHITNETPTALEVTANTKTAHEGTARWIRSLVDAGAFLTTQEIANVQEEGQTQGPLESPIRTTPAKPKGGKKVISRENIVRAFPQARIEEQPGGWRVHVGQSYIDVLRVNEVKVDWEAMERQQGRKYSAEDRKKWGAAGSFGFRTDDGQIHDGLGIIRLAEGWADDGTVRHEALHLARKAGLLTDAEYRKLADQFTTPDVAATPEEQVAKARETWQERPEDKAIWARIHQWLKEILAAIGIDQRTAHDIFRTMESGDFWQRKGMQARDAEAMQLKRMQEGDYQPVDPTTESLKSALAAGPVQIKTDKWTYRAKGLTPDGKIRTTTGQLLPLGPIAEGKWQIVAGNNQPTTASQALAETQAPTPGTYQLAPRPDLANVGETQATRGLQDTVDQLRNDEGKPDTVSDADLEAEAQARFEADPYAERAALIQRGKAGGQLNPVETRLAKKILNQFGAEALMTGDKAAFLEAVELYDAYRETGKEQARAFRQRRDPIETPAQRAQRGIIEAVLEKPPEIQKKIDEARKEDNQDEIDRLNKEWADKFEALKKRLKELGVDLDDLSKLGYDPIKADKALGAISAAKSTWNDVAYEYWHNAILSSLKTQFANITGNTLQPTWHYLVERPVEATINLAIQDPEGATFGEFLHMFDASQGAMKRAARNFWLSYQSELPQFDREVGREGQFKHESPNVAIPGKTGRVIRVPRRFMLASDEFAKSLIGTLEVGARAYRIAQAEGKTGDALQKRIKQLTDDIESAAWDAAYEHTLAMTFQQKGGKVAQQVKQAGLAIRRTSLGKWFLPFVTTPVNILETGINKSPLGTITSLAPKIIANVRKGKPAMKGVTPEAAQQLIAWAVVWGLWSLVPDEEEDRLITGTNKYGKFDARKEKVGPPPMSIRLGDTWYSYARIEPMATALGLAVDWIDSLRAAQAGDITAPLTTPFSSLAKQAKEKTFLEGIGSLVEVLESGLDPDEIMRKGSGFAISWVPNLIRTSGRALDTEVTQQGVWGEGSEKVARIGRRTLQRTELLPGSVTGETTRYDIWGRPLETSAGGPLYRAAVPVDNRKASEFIGDRMIVNWNAKHPNDVREFMQPDRAITIDKKRTDLTDQQYEDYARVSGLVARKLVESAGFTNKPTAEDMDRLKDLVLEARSIARDALKPHWEGKPLDDSEHGIAVLAASGFLRDLGASRPQSLPKSAKAKGQNWKAFIGDYNARIEKAKKYLQDNQITRGEALSAFDKLTADLEPATRRRQRGVLLSRLSKR